MKTDVFIDKAKLVHGNRYDYSLIVDCNIRNKFKIKCNIHGVFEQRGDAHLSGQGCGKCGKSVLKTTKDFIYDANIIHNNKYEYSYINYVNCKTPININCPIHGIFIQTPDNHISGHGCPKCGFKISGDVKKDIASHNFIDKAIAIYGNKFDYTQSEYIDAKTKIIIGCTIHGVFKQTPNDHLSGKSCLFCSLLETRPEIDIKDLLRTSNIDYVENDRNILNGKEIDIYIPNNNLGIEYDGLYWHSNAYKENNYHLNKTNDCEKQDIQLLHIFEDEWINKKEIVKSIIKSKLGLNDVRIYGRKCIIKEIDGRLCKEFLIENHVQGNINSKVKIGLFYDNKLVSVMTFGVKRIAMGCKINIDGEYEMHRFCNKLNTQVIGGASKLLKYFINTYNPKLILTFADRRYSNGNLYKQLGFEFIENTKPNYWYFKSNDLNRYHRYNFRKDILVKDGFDATKTEHQIMEERGFSRIYDSGNMKFILNLT